MTHLINFHCGWTTWIQEMSNLKSRLFSLRNLRKLEVTRDCFCFEKIKKLDHFMLTKYFACSQVAEQLNLLWRYFHVFFHTRTNWEWQWKNKLSNSFAIVKYLNSRHNQQIFARVPKCVKSYWTYSIVIQARIAQLIAYRLDTGEVQIPARARIFQWK